MISIEKLGSGLENVLCIFKNSDICIIWNEECHRDCECPFEPIDYDCE